LEQRFVFPPNALGEGCERNELEWGRKHLKKLGAFSGSQKTAVSRKDQKKKGFHGAQNWE